MSSENASSKNEILFTRLVVMFQTIALQQMGKIADLASGEARRDLEGARLSIDTLDMLSEKCRNNLSEAERRFLDHIRAELKLNYVDEVNRPPGESAKPANRENMNSASNG
ncbi:MAG: DUF1844 domain-containing protein [Calditrichaeota bacterium]|nr:DUF1844 domain-containing protein [Calditrichota bacterium]